ncbi:MAG TPA: carboxymuconolactone decarboxylase family protein [Rhizorhapis sp.]
MKFHDFQQAHSESVVALRALSQSVAAKGMDKVLLELVKIRASQVNGCAYCAQFHINLARKQGCSQSKLDQLAVWRDSPLFNARERLALEWTEALTEAAAHGATGEMRDRVASQFTHTEIETLTIAIATINAWNRIAGPLHFIPPEG